MKKNSVVLTEQMLDWVVNALDRHAKVVSVDQLNGSTSSTLFWISLQLNQREKHVVLRLFDNEEWLAEEPDLAMHEAESLFYAAKADIAAPVIIAFDEKGETCGMPAVLMTMLEGSVELEPDDWDEWLNGLAMALTKIHALDGDGFDWTYFTYQDIPSLGTPSWTSIPDVWEKAIEIVKGPRPIVEECFIHRDYHLTNVLYHEGKVSGVVDWVNACRGPAGVDVGHCRVNLVMLYDVETADKFLSAYQQFRGTFFTYEVFWDLVSLMDILFGSPEVYPGWEAFGVTGLTDKMMEERLDRYVVRLLERV